MTIADSRVVGSVCLIGDPELYAHGEFASVQMQLYGGYEPKIGDKLTPLSLLAEAERTIERTKEDARLGIEVELWVLANCSFTGEPPYVGNAGIMLALNELKAQRDALLAELAKDLT